MQRAGQSTCKDLNPNSLAMEKAFEKKIIGQCAATLAGLKAANLFNHRFPSKAICNASLEEANSVLNGKGVYVELISNCGDFYLLLVYRKNQLLRILTNPSAADFLQAFGYQSNGDTDRMLKRLKERFRASAQFPHEIGIFLGYPIEDIKGFITNRGKNCLLCGLWKVYSNPAKAEEYFKKIDKCNHIYMDVYLRGRSLADMTVAA